MGKGNVFGARGFLWVKNIQRNQFAASHLKAKLGVYISRQCLVSDCLENYHVIRNARDKRTKQQIKMNWIAWRYRNLENYEASILSSTRNKRPENLMVCLIKQLECQEFGEENGMYDEDLHFWLDNLKETA